LGFQLPATGGTVSKDEMNANAVVEDMPKLVETARQKLALEAALKAAGGGGSSDASSVISSIGPMVEGLANGTKTAFETLAGLIAQGAAGKSGGGLSDILGMLLLMEHLEDMRERREQRKAQPERRDGPSWPDVIAILDKRVEDLKSLLKERPQEDKGAWWEGIASQAVQERLFAPAPGPVDHARQIAETLDAFRKAGILPQNQVAGDLSERHLKMAEINADLEKARLRAASEAEGREFWRQTMPMWIQSAIGSFAGVMGVRPANRPSVVAPEAMEAAKAGDS
jgi:hypothetical protein